MSMEQFKTILHKTLTENKETIIKFVKTNGELRTMKCTLHSSYFSVDQNNQNNQNTKDTTKASDTLSVIDLEAEGWRSFKVLSVVMVNDKPILNFLDSIKKEQQ